MKKLTYLIFPIVALTFLAGCGNEAEDTNSTETSRERVVAVGTMTLERISFEDRIRINGTVTAFEDAMIAVETPGQVLYIAERGTSVNKGDIIMRLDDRLLKANFEAAQSGFDLAEDMFNRQSALHADSVISTAQFLQSRTQRDQAKAQLTAIQKQLEDAQLRAPFSGRIEEKFTSVGQFVGPGTPVLRLVNTNKVKITGGVPERFSGRITRGSAVEINFRNYDVPSISSQVRFAGNLINPDSRTFPVEVVLDNANAAIKPLMVVEMRVLRQLVEEQIVIPRTAVVRDESGETIFVVNERNGLKRAEMRRIEVSLTSGDYIVVGSGLNDGDEVIISGLTNLGDGDLLNITNTRSNTSLQATTDR